MRPNSLSSRRQRRPSPKSVRRIRALDAQGRVAGRLAVPSAKPTGICRSASAWMRRTWRFAQAPRPRICPRRALPVSRKAFSMFAVRTALLDACRRCFASLFTDRAISYREAKGFDHLKVALSDRRAADGAVRPCRCGRDVLDRHRNGFRSRRADQRRVGSWRESSCKAPLIPTSIRSSSPFSPIPR